MKFFAFGVLCMLLVGANANYGYASKGGAPATKGGAPPAKGGAKAFLRPQPTLAKRYPTKGLQPIEQQKIEQVVQQEEQVPEEVQQQVEQVPEVKQVKKVGITKWEQRIEPVKPRKKAATTNLRKSLKPAVTRIEQQITQQQQEEEPVQQIVQQEEEPVQQIEQRMEQRPALRRVLKPQKRIQENVRQVPQSFDGHWE